MGGLFSYFFVQNYKINFSTLLIFVPGAKTPRKCYRISFVRGSDSRKKNQCPTGERGRGDPAGAKAPRKLHATPVESEAPGMQINRQIPKNVKRKKDAPKSYTFGTPSFFYLFIFYLRSNVYLHSYGN
jgi:hypothetical protein